MATEESEHVERIPWAELLPHKAASPWVTYGVIGALVAAALVVALTRRQVVAPAPASAVAPTVTPALPDSEAPLVTSGPLPVPSLAAGSPPLYSEADLMAVMPRVAQYAVAGRAEWFVRDLFTAGGESDDWSRVLRHLPQGAIEAGIRPARGSSYVEWARAIEVIEPAPGEFEVLVAFQLLIPEGETYRKPPVRAVTVNLVLDGEGVPAVRDLPAPAPLHFGQFPPSWGQEAEAPAAVAASALATAESWGGDAEILAVARTAAGWRFVLALRDEGGNRWPLAVVIEDLPG